LGRKEITKRGVVPPEKLGMNGRLFEKLTNEMKKKRVIINEEKEMLD
jgi:saccharopine dehydrogenase-like NADP-dependent oxidoreductase